MACADDDVEAASPQAAPAAPRCSLDATTAAAAAATHKQAERRRWLISAALIWACMLYVMARASAAASRPGALLPPLRVPDDDTGTLRFLVFGDWGRQGAEHQSEVAAAMGAAAEQLEVAFAVSTGDNVYERGIASARDPLWRATFTDIYTHPALATLPFLAVAGNHDWVGNVTAQVAARGRGGVSDAEPRWRAHMSFSASQPRTDHWPGVPLDEAAPDDVPPLLSLVYIDTSPWVHEYRAGSSMNWAAAGVVPAGATAAQWLAWEDAQAARLDAALRGSDARWKIVVGHHPIYSYGDHSSQPELARLNGILRAAGAAAYLNGHDHDLQLIVQPPAAAGANASGPVYITSGAGSQTRADVAGPRDSLLFSYGSSGFTALELSWDEMRVHSFDARGARLHTYAQRWQPAPECGAQAAADARCSVPQVSGR